MDESLPHFSVGGLRGSFSQLQAGAERCHLPLQRLVPLIQFGHSTKVQAQTCVYTSIVACTLELHSFTSAVNITKGSQMVTSALHDGG